MKNLTLILLLILGLSIFACGQTPTTTIHYYSSQAQAPTTCVSTNRRHALIYVFNVGLYKCVNNVYVLAEGAGTGGGTGGGDALRSGTLGQFASTTSAILDAVISDNTGGGALVFANSPILTTPRLATILNGSATIALPTTSGTIALVPKQVSSFALLPTTGKIGEAYQLADTGQIFDVINLNGSLQAIYAERFLKGLSQIATADVANDAITFAKLQNLSAGNLIGSGLGGDPAPVAIGPGLSLSTSNVLSATGGGTSGGGDAFVSQPLSQFAPTTSAQLNTVITDNTGSGLAVFNNNPTFTNPVISTIINGGATLTLPTATGTLALTSQITAAQISPGVLLGRPTTGNTIKGAAVEITPGNQMSISSTGVLNTAPKKVGSIAGLPFGSNSATVGEAYQTTDTGKIFDVTGLTNLSEPIFGERLVASVSQVGTGTIVDGAITFAKIGTLPSSTLIGRVAGTSGVTSAISLGANLSMSSTGVLSAATGTGGGGSISQIETVAINMSELDTAISNANASPAVKTSVKLNGTITIATAKIVPANLILERVNDTKLQFATGGSIEFKGIGLKEPMASEPIFYGFSPVALAEPNTATQVPGRVKWTGAKHPLEVNSDMFANTSVSDRVNLTDQAFIDKQVTIHVSAGEINVPIVTAPRRHYRLHGIITNIENELFPPSWVMSDDTWIQGDGMGATVVYDSAAAGSIATNPGSDNTPALFYGSSVGYRDDANAARRRNKNITISDMTIKGSRPGPDNFLAPLTPPRSCDPKCTNPYRLDGTLASPGDQEQSAIMMGNVTNGRIERIHFDHVPGFAAYVGVDSLPGGTIYADPDNFAKNCIIKDNIFDNVGTQAAGAIIGDGLLMSGNQFIDSGYWNFSSQYSNFIDLEPNTRGARMRNVKIIGNTFNAVGRDTRRYMSGIFVQGASGAKDIQIENNQFVGTLLPYGVDQTNANGQNVEAGFSECIHIEDGESIHIANNTMNGCGNSALSVYNSSNITANNNLFRGVLIINGVYDSIFRDNNAPKRNDYNESVGNYKAFSSDLNSDNGLVTESEGVQNVSVTTAAGVSTVYAITCESTCGLFLHMIGRTFYLNADGVNAGFYKFTSINETTQSGTIVTASTSAAGAAGSSVGNGAILRGKGNNNHYINNYSTAYNIPADSRSTVTDNTNAHPVYFYNVFVAGDLTGAVYNIGDLNIGRKTFFNIVSIEANSRTVPGTCTTQAKFRVVGDGDTQTGYASQILDLTVANGVATNSVLGNIFIGRTDSPALLKLETAAAGCTGTVPRDYNVSVGYQTGIKVTRAAAVNPVP